MKPLEWKELLGFIQFIIAVILIPAVVLIVNMRTQLEKITEIVDIMRDEIDELKKDIKELWRNK